MAFARHEHVGPWPLGHRQGQLTALEEVRAAGEAIGAHATVGRAVKTATIAHIAEWTENENGIFVPDLMNRNIHSSKN